MQEAAKKLALGGQRLTSFRAKHPRRNDFARFPHAK
jgi:hypothetical protein